MLFAVFDHADCIGDVGYFFALFPGGLGVYPSGVNEARHLSTQKHTFFGLCVLRVTDLFDDV